MLKRAGLDYWEGVNVAYTDNLIAYLEALPPTTNFYFFSSKAEKFYSSIDYELSDHLIFGSETDGLPTLLWERWPEKFCRIPMKTGARCLNLANSVSVALYEAWRQNHFKTT